MTKSKSQVLKEGYADTDKRLDKLFGIDYSDPNLPSIGITPKVSELKSFLYQELDRAYKRGIEDNEIDFTKRLEVAIKEEREE